MTRDFKEALRHRRTYYHITDSSPISDEQIKDCLLYTSDAADE